MPVMQVTIGKHLGVGYTTISDARARGKVALERNVKIEEDAIAFLHLERC
jgi:hypothetical protein